MLCQADIVTGHRLMSPYVDDVTKIDIDQILAIGNRLKAMFVEMKELNERIEKFKEALGLR